MPRYMITLTPESAEWVERRLGGRLLIGSPGGFTTSVAGLDAITDEEAAPIQARLRSSGPLYHAGGPGGRSKPARIIRHITGVGNNPAEIEADAIAQARDFFGADASLGISRKYTAHTVDAATAIMDPATSARAAEQGGKRYCAFTTVYQEVRTG